MSLSSPSLLVTCNCLNLSLTLQPLPSSPSSLSLHSPSDDRSSAFVPFLLQRKEIQQPALVTLTPSSLPPSSSSTLSVGHSSGSSLSASLSLSPPAPSTSGWLFSCVNCRCSLLACSASASASTSEVCWISKEAVRSSLLAGAVVNAERGDDEVDHEIEKLTKKENFSPAFSILMPRTAQFAGQDGTAGRRSATPDPPSTLSHSTLSSTLGASALVIDSLKTSAERAIDNEKMQTEIRISKFAEEEKARLHNFEERARKDLKFFLSALASSAFPTALATPLLWCLRGAARASATPQLQRFLCEGVHHLDSPIDREDQLENEIHSSSSFPRKMSPRLSIALPQPQFHRRVSIQREERERGHVPEEDEDQTDLQRKQRDLCACREREQREKEEHRTMTFEPIIDVTDVFSLDEEAQQGSAHSSVVENVADLLEDTSLSDEEAVQSLRAQESAAQALRSLIPIRRNARTNMQGNTAQVHIPASLPIPIPAALRSLVERREARERDDELTMTESTSKDEQGERSSSLHSSFSYTHKREASVSSVRPVDMPPDNAEGFVPPHTLAYREPSSKFRHLSGNPSSFSNANSLSSSLPATRMPLAVSSEFFHKESPARFSSINLPSRSSLAVALQAKTGKNS